ncbi:metal ABC transporter substrate-binding protein [Helcococcus ovis]|uniref:metal ABC transporter substrate-binding protein n=1 Tax=Helcococcus ovis TaxID=72026 RepID=UPI0038B98DBF
MKKVILGLVLVFSIILVGCAGNNKNTFGEKKLKVVASFFPPYDLAKKIGGDKIKLRNLTQTGDAHSYEPNIQDMQDIHNSDLLIINGAGFEGWADQVIESQSDLKVLNLSKGMELIKVSDVDSKSKNENDNKVDYDPHTWMNPSYTIKMLKKIKDKFVELDPKNKDFYENNYKKYNEEFLKLIKEHDELLAKYKGKSFVAPHAAFNYVTGGVLNQVAIEGINSVSEPNAARLKEIVEEMKKNNISTVFYEYKKSDKIAKAIANEIGGDVKPISTLEVITQQDIDNGDDYISLMKMNYKNLADSFEKQKN